MLKKMDVAEMESVVGGLDPVKVVKAVTEGAKAVVNFVKQIAAPTIRIATTLPESKAEAPGVRPSGSTSSNVVAASNGSRAPIVNQETASW